MSATEPVLRRSRRLRGFQSAPLHEGQDESVPTDQLDGSRSRRPTRKRKPTDTAGIAPRPSKANRKVPADESALESETPCALSLPRLREEQVLQKSPEIHCVIGIDEAGRGPLAGPVVAAAIHLTGARIPGIIDSKKIGETKREELYETIVASSHAVWAVAVIDAAMIDEINILQATLLGMRVAAAATIQNQAVSLPIRKQATVHEKGCYVVRSKNQLPIAAKQVHALIDGNRLPKDMEFCSKECMVKGDGREYSIAAASILAKVTRDRLMRDYSKQYPEYMFEQHKGYGTAAHIKAITKHGATPIHRMTFAPLKHMNGKVEG